MEFRVLGALEVEGTVALGGPKQRAVLAQLLLAAGEPVPASRLVDEVWGERPPPGAARSLEVYASKLRQAIAPTGAQILRRGTGYALELGAARFDAREFRVLAAAGRAALAGSDPATAEARLTEALALWRGPALAGRAGAALDEERLAAAEDLADASLQLGRAAELVPDLERRAREEPLRERTRAQLMLALYRAGRQADALEAFRAGRAALDELGLEPGAELRELELAILRQDASLAAQPRAVRPRSRLPAPATPLIGRGAELDELLAVVRGGARLVTLTGPGGIGKTRLALAAAGELAADFADGAFFVALAPLADPALVLQTIAGALDVIEADLSEHLAARELLLVLDNFEHVLDAAPAVAELLAAAPDARVLATSRARLDLYGEHDVPVPPLTQEDAAALFVARARAARQGFSAGAGVDELCERFDRLPLALELVAARARDLTLAELVETATLEVAAGGPRDLPERQRTLRAAIAWSEERLTASERELFAALGVFAGGFERDAAEAVWPGGEARLPALVEASLVLRGDDGRLRLLATVREYARARLDAGTEGDAVRSRHLEHYAGLAEELAPKLLGPDDTAAHERLERERDNLRAALAFAREQRLADALLRLVRDLSRFWYVHASFAEGAEWAQTALAGAPAPSLLRAQALKGAALIDWRRAELDLAQARAEEARELLDAEGEEQELLGSLSILGAVAHDRGDLDRAAALFEEGASRARRLGSLSYLSIALNNLGTILYSERDERAGAVYAESLSAARELGSRELEGFAVAGLGGAKFHAGDVGGAASDYRAALRIFGELGFPDRMASACVGLAGAAHAQGDIVEAACLLGASFGLRTETSAQPQERRDIDETRAALTAALGEEAFAAAFEEGAAAPDGVVNRALEGA